MITDSEWIELYTYLLSTLREKGFSEAVQEVEQAATERMIEQLDEMTGSTELARTEEELETVRIRPRNPREVFEAALGVLYTRLVEVPQLAETLQHNLRREAGDIRWQRDIVPQALRDESRGFDLTSLVVDADSRSSLDAELHGIFSLIGQDHDGHN